MNNLIAGVDEVGRGCLAGPVISAAVILDKKHKIDGLKDSKKITPKKRKELFDIIVKNAISIGVGSCDPETIDKINIREATFSSMRKAVKNLSTKPKKILIDGERLENIKIPNEGIIKGDSRIDSIMAASIIAKVTRDKLMKEYSILFPEYGFENHKGYGTKQHLKALENFKSSPIHRNSFKPVKNNLISLKWVIRNKRLDWIGKKLAGLFLINRNHKIVALDYFTDSLNIYIDLISISKKNIIFSEVYSSLMTGKTVTDQHNFTKKSYLKHKKRFEQIKNNFSTKLKYRFDRIFLSIRNGPPIINRDINVNN